MCDATVSFLLKHFHAQSWSHFVSAILLELLLQLRLRCVFAAFMLRLRHIDEMNMFNCPASACSNFNLHLQLRLCWFGKTQHRRSIDAVVKAALTKTCFSSISA
jgi:hypothetical protein